MSMPVNHICLPVEIDIPSPSLAGFYKEAAALLARRNMGEICFDLENYDGKILPATARFENKAQNDRFDDALALLKRQKPRICKIAPSNLTLYWIGIAQEVIYKHPMFRKNILLLPLTSAESLYICYFSPDDIMAKHFVKQVKKRAEEYRREASEMGNNGYIEQIKRRGRGLVHISRMHSAKLRL